jgi:hypothetical protein
MSWKFNIGIHRGTLTSRDSQVVAEHFDDHTKPLTSLEEVTETAKKWQSTYARSGYVIWFAKALSPEGTETTVLQGTSYR